MFVMEWCIRLYLNTVSRAASSQHVSSSPAVVRVARTDSIVVRLRRSAIPFYWGWWGVRRW